MSTPNSVKGDADAGRFPGNLRDWFASMADYVETDAVWVAKALGLPDFKWGNDPVRSLQWSLSVEVAYRYAYADAMLAERLRGMTRKQVRDVGCGDQDADDAERPDRSGP